MILLLCVVAVVCVDLTAQRELIEKGYVFIACPPLFKIKQGKTEKYVYTQVRDRAVCPTGPPTLCVPVGGARDETRANVCTQESTDGV